MKKISLFGKKIQRRLNDLSLRKKLRYLYYFCILIPIIFTDIIIMHSLIGAEWAEQRHEREAIASSVQYQLTTFVDNSSVVARSIYMNDTIQAFLSTYFENPEEYVKKYHNVMHNSLLENIMGIDNTVITVYADNETIVNGGGFTRLSDVTQTEWYQRYKENSRRPQIFRLSEIYVGRSRKEPLPHCYSESHRTARKGLPLSG